MVEKLIRPLPPHVLQAKLAGNTELLSELGRRGALVANKRRALRKIEAERKARDATSDLFAEEVLEEFHQAQMLAGAEENAVRNLIGWCDDEV